MYVNSLAVGQIPRNSKIFYVTVNNWKSYLIILTCQYNLLIVSEQMFKNKMLSK